MHILPSRAMRADALAQYMMKKRWNKWFLVIGATEEDRLFADALKRAAKRFGMKIVEEKTWEHTYDARRTAQSDVAVFTQVDDYDVLLFADEQGQFGEYLEYRTWNARPVIGTQGLVATACIELMNNGARCRSKIALKNRPGAGWTSRIMPPICGQSHRRSGHPYQI